MRDPIAGTEELTSILRSTRRGLPNASTHGSLRPAGTGTDETDAADSHPASRPRQLSQEDWRLRRGEVATLAHLSNRQIDSSGTCIPSALAVDVVTIEPIRAEPAVG
jgi:hypothetical protein